MSVVTSQQFPCASGVLEARMPFLSSREYCLGLIATKDIESRKALVSAVQYLVAMACAQARPSGVGTAGAPGADAPVKFYLSEVENHNMHAWQRGSCAV